MTGEKARFTSDRRVPSTSSWADDGDWAAGVAEDVDVVDGGLIGRPPNQHSELPDSEANQKLVHRWVLDDVNGTVEDIVGNADGTNNGVTAVSGDWAGGSAGDGDGTDDNIETTTWGGFGSGMGSGFAIAFTIKTSDGMGTTLNTEQSDDTGIWVTNRGAADTGSGSLSVLVRDSSGDIDSIETSSSIDDGTTYRVVWNKPSTIDPSNWEVWLNQTQSGTSVGRDAAGSSFSDFVDPVTFFAERGGSSNNLNGILDDICVFDDTLTSTEAQSYENPWE